ncbi:hypothetical protein IRY55_01105 [Savagea sp. SN6]|uniref:Magnesium transporter MgtE intracellular domain-containing protein n=1 Tax=Savagea serpentis TaxID=2785297 RepID=A0A8J7GJH7_9BACL|nr:hypothetical protein [Savagea serpentis]MBF4499943.1 hypothetical protein [Savagea serpentis]
MAEEREQLEVEEGKKKPSILKILILWLVVPLLFVSAVLLIVAKVADVNVIDQAKKWTTEVIKGEPDPQLEQPDFSNDEKVVTLQAELQQKDNEIAKVEQQLQMLKEENELLVIEQERLTDEIAKVQNRAEESKKEFKEIIATYEKLSAKNAAPILLAMNEADALKILASLKPDTVAAILEKMEPEQAAKFTTLLSK